MPLINSNKFVASMTSGHTAVSTGPTDICKTPAPPAPVPPPMPYPNVATLVPPGPGYATKTFTMGTPMYTKNSKTAMSNGDQPGVALNVVSNKIMGMCAVTMCCNDVEAEGGGLVRTADTTDSNT